MIVIWYVPIQSQRYQAKLKNLSIKTKFFVTGCTIVSIILLSFAAYRLKPASADGRMVIYKVCTNIIQDYPLSGVGFGAIGSQYGTYQAQYFEHHPEDKQGAWLADDVKLAYNEFLHLATEIGLPGCATVIFLMAMLLRRFRPQMLPPSPKRGIIIGAFASIVAILLTGLFSYPFHILPVTLHFALMSGLLVAFTQANSKARTYSFQSVSIRIFSVILLAGSLALEYHYIQEFKALSEWKSCSDKAKKGDFSRQEYQNLYPVLQHNSYYLYNYGAELCQNESYEEGLKILLQAHRFISSSDIHILLGKCYEEIGNYSEAGKYYVRASFVKPNRLAPHYALAKMYQKTQQIELSALYAKNVEKMPIKVINEKALIIKSEMSELLQTLKTSNHQ
jgi:tetratricopeptide (TPR) repeat protein